MLRTQIFRNMGKLAVSVLTLLCFYETGFKEIFVNVACQTVEELRHHGPEVSGQFCISYEFRRSLWPKGFVEYREP